MADFFVKNLKRDPVVICQHQVGERCRKERGIFQLGQVRPKSHGGAAIKEDVAFEVGFEVMRAEVMPVGARIYPPVNQRAVVPRRVLAVLVKFDRRAALAGAVGAGQIAFHESLWSELEALQLTNIFRS